MPQVPLALLERALFLRLASLHAGPALPANPAKLVAVGQRQESVAIADLVLQALDLGLEELDDPPALIANQMVVVLSRPQPLVPIAGFADPHPPHDSGVDQQIQRAIDRRPRDFLVLGAQTNQQLVGLEVLVTGEELVVEGLPLGRQLQAPALEVLAENLPFPVAHAIAT